MIDSYHCSRYNTQTRRLTAGMFVAVVAARRELALAPGASGVIDGGAAAFDAEDLRRQPPGRPGVYRMLDAQGEILYVGKARSLKSRVGSYFQPGNVQPKVQALVAKTAAMEVTVTNSDTEALLLE